MRKQRTPPKPSFAIRFALIALSSFYFTTNCALIHATETNFWKERQRIIQLAGFAEPSNPFHLPPSASASVLETKGDLARLGHELEFGSPLVNQLRRLPGVASVHLIRGLTTAPTVVHIQDVHADPTAQTNIAGIIKAIHGQAPLVAVEGAFRPADLSGFEKFRDKESIRIATKFLLGRGEISGPLFAALNQGTHLPLVGIDDEVLYHKNLDAYRGSSASNTELENKLERMHSTLRQQGQRLNPELSALERSVDDYRSRKISLSQLTRELASHDSIIPGSVQTYLKAEGVGKSLDQKAAEKERQSFQEGHDPSEIQLDRYKNLQRALHYLSLIEQLDPEQLTEDVDHWLDQVRVTLCRSDTEKNFLKDKDALYFADRLMNFSLTSTEWNRTSSLVGAANDSIKSLLQDSRFDSYRHFYELAKSRDRSMTRRVSELTKNLETGSMILVTGGFHSTGIDTALNRTGVNIVSVTPQAGSAAPPIDSLKRMAQASPYESVLDHKALFLSPLQSDGLMRAAIQTSAAFPNSQEVFKQLLPGVPTSLTRKGTALELAGSQEIFDGDRQADGSITWRLRFKSIVFVGAAVSLLTYQYWWPSVSLAVRSQMISMQGLSYALILAVAWASFVSRRGNKSTSAGENLTASLFLAAPTRPLEKLSRRSALRSLGLFTTGLSLFGVALGDKRAPAQSTTNASPTAEPADNAISLAYNALFGRINSTGGSPFSGEFLQHQADFNDPLLASLIEEAMKGSPDVDILGARFQSAQAYLSKKKWALGPTGKATAEGFFPGDQNFTGSAKNFFEATLSLVQKIDIWGEERSKAKAAKNELMAKAAELEHLRQSVAATVALAYFAIVQANAQHEIAVQAVANASDLLAIAKSRVESNLASDLEVLSADEALRKTHVELSLIELGRGKLIRGLEVAMGRDPAGTLVVPANHLPLVAGTDSSATSTNVNNLLAVQASQFRSAEATNLYSAAQAARLPTISLGILGQASSGIKYTNFTRYGANSFNATSLEQIAGNVVSGLALTPFLNYGQLKADANAAKANEKEAGAEEKKITLATKLAIEDTLAEITELKKQEAEHEQSVANSLHILGLTRTNYEQELVGLADVLAAEKKLLAAKSDLIKIHGSLIAAYVQLRRATAQVIPVSTAQQKITSSTSATKRKGKWFLFLWVGIVCSLCVLPIVSWAAPSNDEENQPKITSVEKADHLNRSQWILRFTLGSIIAAGLYGIYKYTRKQFSSEKSEILPKSNEPSALAKKTEISKISANFAAEPAAVNAGHSVQADQLSGMATKGSSIDAPRSTSADETRLSGTIGEVVIAGVATVVFESDPQGRRRIERIYYDAPLGEDARIAVTTHIRFKYFTAEENSTLAGRLRQITNSTLNLSNGIITKISYELVYDGTRVVQMQERVGRTQVGQFDDAVNPAFAYRLVIANKIKPGVEPNVQVFADIGRPKNGNVPIFVYTKLAKAIRDGRLEFAVAGDAIPIEKSAQDQENQSHLFREIFSRVSDFAEGEQPGTEIIYFGDHDQLNRPRWAITTDLSSVANAGHQRIIEAITLRDYEPNGALTESHFNLINGHPLIWRPELALLRQADLMTVLKLSHRSWGQQKKFAPAPDPNNTFAHYLESVTSLSVAPNGTLRGKRIEQYALVEKTSQSGAKAGGDDLDDKLNSSETREPTRGPNKDSGLTSIRSAGSWASAIQDVREKFVRGIGLDVRAEAAFEEALVQSGIWDRTQWKKEHKASGLHKSSLDLLAYLMMGARMVSAVFFWRDSIHRRNLSASWEHWVHDAFNQVWKNLFVPIEVHVKATFHRLGLFPRLVETPWFGPASIGIVSGQTSVALTKPADKVVDQTIRKRVEWKYVDKEFGPSWRTVQRRLFAMEYGWDPFYSLFARTHPDGVTNSNFYLDDENHSLSWLRQGDTFNGLRIRMRVRRYWLHPFDRVLAPGVRPKLKMEFKTVKGGGLWRTKPAFEIWADDLWKVLQYINDPDNVLVKPWQSADRLALEMWLHIARTLKLRPVSNIEYARAAIRTPYLDASRDRLVRGMELTWEDVDRLMEQGSDAIVNPHGHFLYYPDTYFDGTPLEIIELKHASHSMPPFLPGIVKEARLKLLGVSKFTDFDNWLRRWKLDRFVTATPFDWFMEANPDRMPGTPDTALIPDANISGAFDEWGQAPLLSGETNRVQTSALTGHRFTLGRFAATTTVIALGLIFFFSGTSLAPAQGLFDSVSTMLPGNAGIGGVDWWNIVRSVLTAGALGLAILLSFVVFHNSKNFEEDFPVSILLATTGMAFMSSFLKESIMIGIPLMGMFFFIRSRFGERSRKDQMIFMWSVLVGAACGWTSPWIALGGAAVPIIILIIEFIFNFGKGRMFTYHLSVPIPDTPEAKDQLESILRRHVASQAKKTMKTNGLTYTYVNQITLRNPRGGDDLLSDLKKIQGHQQIDLQPLTGTGSTFGGYSFNFAWPALGLLILEQNPQSLSRLFGPMERLLVISAISVVIILMGVRRWSRNRTEAQRSALAQQPIPTDAKARKAYFAKLNPPVQVGIWPSTIKVLRVLSLPLLIMGLFLGSVVMHNSPRSGSGGAFNAFPGMILPNQSASVKPPASGRLINLNITNLDEVIEGQILGYLLPSDVEQTRMQLDLAKSQLDLAKSQMDVDKWRADTQVRLAELRTQLEATQAKLKLAQTNLQALQRAQANHAVAGKDVQAAQALVEELTPQITGGQQVIRTTEEVLRGFSALPPGTRSGTDRINDVIGHLDANQLNLAGNVLGLIPIRAPVSGHVVNKTASSGEEVREGVTPICDLVSFTKPRFVAGWYSGSPTNVFAGMIVRLVDEGRTAIGVVRKTDPNEEPLPQKVQEARTRQAGVWRQRRMGLTGGGFPTTVEILDRQHNFGGREVVTIIPTRELQTNAPVEPVALSNTNAPAASMQATNAPVVQTNAPAAPTQQTPAAAPVAPEIPAHDTNQPAATNSAPIEMKPEIKPIQKPSEEPVQFAAPQTAPHANLELGEIDGRAITVASLGKFQFDRSTNGDVRAVTYSLIQKAFFVAEVGSPQISVVKENGTRIGTINISDLAENHNLKAMAWVVGDLFALVFEGRSEIMMVNLRPGQRPPHRSSAPVYQLPENMNHVDAMAANFAEQSLYVGINHQGKSEIYSVRINPDNGTVDVLQAFPFGSDELGSIQSLASLRTGEGETESRSLLVLDGVNQRVREFVPSRNKLAENAVHFDGLDLGNVTAFTRMPGRRIFVVGGTKDKTPTSHDFAVLQATEKPTIPRLNMLVPVFLASSQKWRNRMAGLAKDFAPVLLILAIPFLLPVAVGWSLLTLVRSLVARMIGSLFPDTQLIWVPVFDQSDVETLQGLRKTLPRSRFSNVLVDLVGNEPGLAEQTAQVSSGFTMVDGTSFVRANGEINLDELLRQVQQNHLLNNKNGQLASLISQLASRQGGRLSTLSEKRDLISMSPFLAERNTFLMYRFGLWLPLPTETLQQLLSKTAAVLRYA